MDNKRNIEVRVLLFLLFICAFFTSCWVLGSENSLILNDFTVICKAKFNAYSDIFELFPSKINNNRSVSLMFIKVLLDVFGTNYKMYNYIFLIIHFVNMLFAYLIGIKLFINDKNDYIYATVISAIFGLYPTSILAVQSISGIYDLLSCFFILSSIFYYIKAGEEKRYYSFYGILSIFLYYLSIRSKEMALVLPIILIIYELGKAIINKTHITIPWFLWFSMMLMLSYSYMIFTFDMEAIEYNGYCYRNFNPISIIRNGIRYLLLYCDLGNGFFAYNKMTVYGFPMLFILITTIIFSMYLMIGKKEIILFLSVLCIGCSLIVVLPMVNIQHRLFLYIPSFFIGISVTILFKIIIDYFNIKKTIDISIILIFSIYMCVYTPGIINFREYWKSLCIQGKYTFEQIIKNIPPIEGSTIYVEGASEIYNTIYYGFGDCVKLAYNDNSIGTILVDSFPDNPKKPYVFWKYDNGNIKEVERENSKFDSKILVYPDKISLNKDLNKDGTVYISVVPSDINSNMSIVINGEILQTTIGKDFISAVIQPEMLNSSQLEVYIQDKSTNQISEKEIVTIN